MQIFLRNLHKQTNINQNECNSHFSYPDHKLGKQLGTTDHTGRLWLNLCQNSRNIVFAKIWHSMALMALQDTKKPIKYWKRPTKAEKVILKAGESKNGKIMIFFHFCDHLVSKIKGIQYFDVSRSKRPKRPHY